MIKSSKLQNKKSSFFSQCCSKRLGSKLLDENQIKKEIDLYRTKISKFVGRVSPVINEARLIEKEFYSKAHKGCYLILIMEHIHMLHLQILTKRCINWFRVSVKNLGFILGIVKAYNTRVGSGPFPSSYKMQLVQN